MSPNPGGTTARGYGSRHQAERDKHKPAVETGHAYCTEIICLMEDRWIPPGSAWDLAHDRVNGGYLGPAHCRCNRAEGGREKHRRKRIQQGEPTRWKL